ncbi:MAG: hypothetical protein IJF56_06180 [Clostridia bacterium]|nr:hypothetical protein [Clostridia bacterium]
MSKKAEKGKKGAGRKNSFMKKIKLHSWIFWAVLTTLNLIISVIMRVSDRKDAITAIQKDEKLSLLYTGEKTTKNL